MIFAQICGLMTKSCSSSGAVLRRRDSPNFSMTMKHLAWGYRQFCYNSDDPNFSILPQSFSYIEVSAGFVLSHRIEVHDTLAWLLLAYDKEHDLLNSTCIANQCRKSSKIDEMTPKKWQHSLAVPYRVSRWGLEGRGFPKLWVQRRQPYRSDSRWTCPPPAVSHLHHCQHN